MGFFFRGEVPHGVAELNGVALGVTNVNRPTEFMIHFQHRVAMRSPTFPMGFEILDSGSIESNVVGPPGQARTLVEVGAEFGANGLIVNLPEGDHALLSGRRSTSGVEEVLTPSAFRGRGGDGLDQFEAHDLGVEVEIGLGISDGDSDVVESHG